MDVCWIYKNKNIKILPSLIPEWIKNSEVYKSMIETDDDDEINVNLMLIKDDNKINDINDFLQIIQIIDYWDIKFDNFDYVNKHKELVIKNLYKIDNIPTAYILLYQIISSNYKIIKLNNKLCIKFNNNLIYMIWFKDVSKFIKKLSEHIKLNKKSVFSLKKYVKFPFVSEEICIYEQNTITFKSITYLINNKKAYIHSNKINVEIYIDELNKNSIF